MFLVTSRDLNKVVRWSRCDNKPIKGRCLANRINTGLNDKVSLNRKDFQSFQKVSHKYYMAIKNTSEIQKFL